MYNIATFKNIFLLFVTISIIACSDTKAKSRKLNKKNVIPFAESLEEQAISPDSTIIAFLTWYRDNEERLRQIQLVKGGLEDTTTFYSVDFLATEKYLSELKKSGYVSNKFLDTLRQNFNKSNEDLKAHPQNDGPPPGFEADLIMKAQDYMSVWDGLNKAKLIEKNINNNTAHIVYLFADYYRMKFLMSKSGKHWLIDSLDWIVESN